MLARARRYSRPINVDAYMLYNRSTLGDVGLVGAGVNVSAATLRLIQTALNKLPSSLARLSLDGKMGPKTAARLAEYQGSVGLPVTSAPDASTQARLLGSGSPVITSAPPTDYYVKGTKFLWLVPSPITGFGLSFDPGEDARASLAAKLGAAGYNVRVIYSSGNALEVSGSQNTDRASIYHIRDQITQTAQAAGFTLGPLPVQFSVEKPGSTFQVGNTGSQTTWADTTPPIVTGIPTELGLNPFGDKNAGRNLPSLSGSWTTIALIVGAALIVKRVLTG